MELAEGRIQRLHFDLNRVDYSLSGPLTSLRLTRDSLSRFPGFSNLDQKSGPKISGPNSGPISGVQSLGDRENVAAIKLIRN